MYLFNASLGLIERVEQDGRLYIKAPLVGITAPSVLNGAFVGLDEVTASLERWNDVPLVIDHPVGEDDNPIPASSEGVVSVGRLTDIALNDGKMTGFAMIDIAKAALVEKGIALLHSLTSEQPVEVSSAYHADLEPAAGDHNGVAYNMITKHIDPDHMALLPDARGACSWSDGCGIPRINQESDEDSPFTEGVTPMREKIIQMLLVNCDCSQADLEAKSDDDLLAMLNPPTEEAETEETEEAAPVTNSEESVQFSPPPAQTPGDDFVKDLVEEMGGKERFVELLTHAGQIGDDQRQDTIQTVVGAYEGLDADDVQDLPMAVLQKLATNAPKKAPASYAGASPFVNTEGDEWEDYVTPTLN